MWDWFAGMSTSVEKSSEFPMKLCQIFQQDPTFTSESFKRENGQNRQHGLPTTRPSFRGCLLIHLRFQKIMKQWEVCKCTQLREHHCWPALRLNRDLKAKDGTVTIHQSTYHVGNLTRCWHSCDGRQLSLGMWPRMLWKEERQQMVIGQPLFMSFEPRLTFPERVWPCFILGIKHTVRHQQNNFILKSKMM